MFDRDLANEALATITDYLQKQTYIHDLVVTWDEDRWLVEVGELNYEWEKEFGAEHKILAEALILLAEKVRRA